MDTESKGEGCILIVMLQIGRRYGGGGVTSLLVSHKGSNVLAFATRDWRGWMPVPNQVRCTWTEREKYIAGVTKSED